MSVSTEIVESACVDCAAPRRGRSADITRSARCRSCAVAAYNATRSRKTPAQKAETYAQWYQKNRARADKQSRDWLEKKRCEVVGLLGGKCVRCEISDPIVLAIDHVNDDGAADPYRKTRSALYSKLISGELDCGRYQLLCHNCNWRKESLRRKDAQR